MFYIHSYCDLIGKVLHAYAIKKKMYIMLTFYAAYNYYVHVYFIPACTCIN